MSKGIPQLTTGFTQLCLARVRVWQLNLLESQDPPGQAGQVQQQAHGLFEGLVIISLKQRREAAADGLTCRLLSRDVKRLLESLTPKHKDLSDGRLRRSSRLGGHRSNSTNTSYSIRQPPILVSYDALLRDQVQLSASWLLVVKHTWNSPKSASFQPSKMS